MGCPYLGVTLQNQDIFIEPAAGGLLGKKFRWYFYFYFNFNPPLSKAIVYSLLQDESHMTPDECHMTPDERHMAPDKNDIHKMGVI